MADADSETPNHGSGVSDATTVQKQGTQNLSDLQRERIQRNKERARSIRQARMQSNPYDVSHNSAQHINTGTDSTFGVKSSTYQSGVCSTSSACKDTCGGFFLEEEDEILQERDHQVVTETAPALFDEQMVCSECGKRFAESFLFSKFSFSVCDQCRDPKGKHSLITKTEAKQKYLLKDCDFGERGGAPLPFILKRNPHAAYRGDMYLYLTVQVEARSHEVWGGEEGLEGEHKRKREAREKKREKKYANEIKSLRKAVRLSMTPSSSKSHEHIFSGETYCSETDTWTKTCSECGHEISYEKM